MPSSSRPERILLVTGLSGAGKSTVLKTLEDLGWETVDNLPLSLLDSLLATPSAAGAERERPVELRPVDLGRSSQHDGGAATQAGVALGPGLMGLLHDLLQRHFRKAAVISSGVPRGPRVRASYPITPWLSRSTIG